MYYIDSAPIAKIDFDDISNPCLSSNGSNFSLNKSSSQGIKRANSDILGAEIDANITQSLENLITNFDDTLFSINSLDQIGQPIHNLESVKSLWKIAERKSEESDKYPFTKPIKILDLNNVSDFDLEDVDAFSDEDYEEPGIINPVPENTALDDYEDEEIEILYKNEIFNKITPTALANKEDDSEIESLNNSLTAYKKFRDSYPSFLNIDVGILNKWINELYKLPKEMILMYLSDLKATVKSFSDVLVEYLALREELIMIHEHFEEFVSLMKLLQARRKKAANAALLNISKSERKCQNSWIPDANTCQAKNGSTDTNLSFDSLSTSFNKLRDRLSFRSSIMSLDLSRNNEAAARNVSNGHSFDALSNVRRVYNSNKLEEILKEDNLLPRKYTVQKRSRKRIPSHDDFDYSTGDNWPNNQPILSHSLGIKISIDPLLELVQSEKEERNMAYSGVEYGPKFCYHIRLINIILRAVLAESPKVPSLISDYELKYSSKDRLQLSTLKVRARSRSKARSFYEFSFNEKNVVNNRNNRRFSKPSSIKIST